MSLCAVPAPLVLDVPMPRTAAFEEDGYYVWGGSIVKDDAGTYHMFYSRWKKSYGFGGWKTHSEIAHTTPSAISPSPLAGTDPSDFL